VSLTADWLQRLPRALHALSSPPGGEGWNAAELSDLVPATLHPAAVLVGLVARDAGHTVLLTRRHAGLRHHGGQISFPGGRIDPEDTGPVAAALREASEEVGLAPTLAQPLGFLDPFVTITGFHVFPVVARIDAAFVPAPDPREVDEAFEVPLDYLLDAGNARPFDVEYQGRHRRIIEIQYGPHRIWGATAAMLVNFRERLERAP
jgi:8-oxo-dGTP pyrophosphatase MutT (NUDIX family)